MAVKKPFRIVMHWTAGGYIASSLDREDYHFVVQGDGEVVRGNRNPEANNDTTDGDYSAHTRGLNTGAIGISMAAMAGANESPFSAGQVEIKPDQLEAFCQLAADLCDNYGIPVTGKTVLTHAEVQPVLGVWQRGKWDICWIPGMQKTQDPVVVGEILRGKIRRALADIQAQKPKKGFIASLLRK